MEALAAKLRAVADPEGFDDVYRAHVRPILRFFVRRTFDIEAARELTAETFAQALVSRKRFRGTTDAEVGGWLFAIAHRQLVRYTRRGIAQRDAIDRLGIQVPQVAEGDYDRIFELAGLQDLRAAVAEAFSSLPPGLQDAVRLRVLDEHCYRDVAEILGTSELAARARVSRGLRTLFEAVGPRPETSS